jgi:uncharacterized protein with PQ loop repeat
MIKIFELFKNAIEYKEFGLNALTISASATILFSLLQGYGILGQSNKIWKTKSGEALSGTFFFYNFFYFLIFLIYGINQKSIAMSFNGALCFLYIPILIGLRKYKGFSKGEKITAGFMSLIVPAMILYSQKHQLLFLFSLIAIVAIVNQFKEIFKTGDFGALSRKYIWMFFITSIFWSIYFAATENWLLEIPCVTGTVLYCLALIFEKIKRPTN